MTPVPSRNAVLIIALILSLIVLIPATYIGWLVNDWLGDSYGSFLGSVFASITVASVLVGTLSCLVPKEEK